MTTLTQTSRIVATNRTLSDLSFLATCVSWDPPGPHCKAAAPSNRESICTADPATSAELAARSAKIPIPLTPCRGAKGRKSGQQSSAGPWTGTPTSQTGVVCVPSGRLPFAPSRLTTAHCSLAPSHLIRSPPCRPPAVTGRRRRPNASAFYRALQLQHRVLERSPALGVVAEPVEARARRGEEHDAVGGGSGIRMRDRFRHRRRIHDRHHTRQRLADQRRGFPDGHHPATACGERVAQLAEVAPLEPAADDCHDTAFETLDRPTRRLDVRCLRIVDEA